MEYMEQQMDNFIESNLKHQEQEFYNMRKQLTENVIHPYLPYGLEVDILNYKCDYVGISKALLIGYYYLIDSDKNDKIHYNYLGGATGKDLSLIKPYLVPLYKLNLEWFHKNISPNIEKFFLQHERNLLLNMPTVLYQLKFSDKWYGLNFNEYQLLFKDKFDMFNLINSGLANEIILENND